MTDLDKLYSLVQKAQRLRKELDEVEAQIVLAAGSASASTPKTPSAPRGGLRDAIRGHMKLGTKYTTKQVAEALKRPQAEVGDAMQRMDDLTRVSRATFVRKRRVGHLP